MEELTYWRIKAQLASLEIKQRMLGDELNNVMQEKKKIFEANDMELGSNYTFDDNKFEITNVNQSNEERGLGTLTEDPSGTLQ